MSSRDLFYVSACYLAFCFRSLTSQADVVAHICHKWNSCEFIPIVSVIKPVNNIVVQSTLQIESNGMEKKKKRHLRFTSCIGFGSLGVNIRLYCAWHVFPIEKNFVPLKRVVLDGPSI